VSSAQNNCQTCPTNCLQCAFSASTQSAQCTTCVSQFYLYNGVCYTNCPPSTYIQSNSCVNCSSQCATCSSASVCLTCKYPYVLSQNQCLSSCPAGSQPLNQICYSSPTCTQYLYKSICYSVCPIGTYASTNVCLNCPSFCATCTSNNNCGTCQNSAYLFFNSTALTSLCVQSCPFGAYINNLNCAICP
jgi:hypothetical protein